MRVTVTEFLTLDGVYEEISPWRAGFAPDDGPFKRDELFVSDALLLGRVTYEGFAAYWPTATGAFAERMNALPKYVATSTRSALEWNATPLGEDVVQAVRTLRQRQQGNLLVYGSGTLVQTLLRHGLVDELRVMVFPVVLGRGRRLFADGDAMRLTLVSSGNLGSGVLLLIYRPADAAPHPPPLPG